MLRFDNRDCVRSSLDGDAMKIDLTPEEAKALIHLLRLDLPSIGVDDPALESVLLKLKPAPRKRR
jgi:hypothetical protein